MGTKSENTQWNSRIKRARNGSSDCGYSDSFHLVEINPRLGGATPLFLKLGFSIYWTLSEFINPNAKIKEISKIKHGMKLLKKDGQVSIT